MVSGIGRMLMRLRSSRRSCNDKRKVNVQVQCASDGAERAQGIGAGLDEPDPVLQPLFVLARAAVRTAGQVFCDPRCAQPVVCFSI